MNWFAIVLIVLGAITLATTVIMLILTLYSLATGKSYFEVYEMSHGDNIREYSNEELADFLTAVAMAERKKMKRSEYRKLWLNWLEQKG